MSELIEEIAFRSQLWYDEEAPLHLAAYCGHNDVVGMLVDRGADIDAFNVYRDTLDCVTPLHFAVYKNKISTVRLLLRMGADPTLFGKWGRAEGTAIQFARWIVLIYRERIQSGSATCVEGFLIWFSLYASQLHLVAAGIKNI